MYIEFINDSATVEVIFNALSQSPNINCDKASFSRRFIKSVWDFRDDNHIKVDFVEGQHWEFNLTGGGSFLPVSKINGVAVTSLDEIYDYLKSLQV